MSLAMRFSAFFLAALAVVLAGFSLTLFGLASRHLHRELDDRLNAALDTLEASIDVEPGGLEWEPEDRRILLGTETDVDDVRWVVMTGDGMPVDRSANLAGGPFPDDWRPAQWPTDPPDGTALGDQGTWRLAGRRLQLDDLLRLGRGHPEDDGPENDIEYPALILVAGLDPQPIAATLRQLVVALAAISTVLWLLCAALGSWLARRALWPVARMAAVARGMSAADGASEIPPPGTRDELDELAGAFNGLVWRLRAAIDQQRRFAGDASHQLRTPLAGMLSLVDVLRRRPRSREEYEQGLDQLHDEAARMRQIVESLLFLARSGADALPLACEPLDLSAWLPAQLARWESHARFGDMRLHVDAAPARVQAHAALLSQLVDNLLDNACQYCEPDTPITVRLSRRGTQVLLTVEDRGRGIAAEDLPHLFEPFYRSDDARRRNQRGSGLGLAVVQRIAASLGARVAAESLPGEPTRFVVTFDALPGTTVCDEASAATLAP